MRALRPDPLATILFGKGKRAILAQLLGSPDRRFFVREIARGASVTASTLSRDLAALTEAGILERAQEGRQVYYQANARCPVFEELKGLVTKTFGFADVLRTTLSPFADRIFLAFIYGSVARGEQTARSDIDLMIVGDVGIAGFSERLLEAEKRLAREIVPTVFSKKEFRTKVRAENHFLLSVLSNPVILLIGDNDDLQRLAGRKPSKSR